MSVRRVCQDRKGEQRTRVVLWCAFCVSVMVELEVEIYLLQVTTDFCIRRKGVSVVDASGDWGRQKGSYRANVWTKAGENAIVVPVEASYSTCCIYEGELGGK